MKVKPLYVAKAVHEKLVKQLDGTGIKLQTFVEDTIIEALINGKKELDEKKEKRIGFTRTKEEYRNYENK